ncbi:MAG: SAM-dependent methyltransferase [Actinomycetales bacterium]|nr:MAG: SAM-dependent methyltransferase [Actinomycetales bacterium]
MTMTLTPGDLVRRSHTAAPPASSTPAPPPGAAAGHLERLGRPVVLCDLYDRTGFTYYDQLARFDPGEIPVLLRAISGRRGRVLELAAGAGRLTLPMLALGLSVTALDLSEELLALLQERSEARGVAAGRCTVVVADMTDFDLRDRFDTVVLGSISATVLDGVGRRLLMTATMRHLCPDGVFLLTLGHYDTSRAYDRHYAIRGATGAPFDLFEHYEAGAGYRTVTVIPQQPDGDFVPVCISRPRVVDPDIVLAEAAEAGFQVTRVTPIAEVTETFRECLYRLEVGS